MKKIIIVSLIVSLFSSCSNYYKAITSSGPATAASVTEQQTKHKYFILHSGIYGFAMKNVRLTDNGNAVSCDLDSLQDEHLAHFSSGSKYTKREVAVLDEVHFYNNTDTTASYGQFVMPLSHVQKIEVIEKDERRTTNNHVKMVLITVGAVGALVVGGLFAAASTLAF